MRDFKNDINDAIGTSKNEHHALEYGINTNDSECLSAGGFTSPIISVIIPVLQEEKIIASTLQTYNSELRKKYRIELIVSDGGSTDNTVNIAKEYADKVVQHSLPQKQTISKGRNLGAAAAIGDILVFINGDTIPQNPDSFFENIYNWQSQNLKYGSASALACPVTISPDQILMKDRIFYSVHNLYVRFLNSIGMGMGRGECQIVKKEIFQKVGGYNDKIAAGEDFDLYRRIGKIGEIHFAKDLWVYESPRRFRRYGYIPILWQWTLNSLAVMFCGRSISKEWEAVR